MIHLISGNIKERTSYIHALVLSQKKDSSELTRITEDDIREDTDFSQIITTQSDLFGDKHLYVLEDLSRKISNKDLLQEYADSEHIIIFSEKSITKKIQQQFQELNAEIHEFKVEPKMVKNAPYNIFTLTDLLGRRDKKNLWLAYRKALEHSSPEEINAVLLWQLRNMAMVQRTKGPVPGMKPFVYQKNQTFIKKYSDDEVNKLIRTLTEAFHTRDRYDTFDVQIEKIILSL